MLKKLLPVIIVLALLAGYAGYRAVSARSSAGAGSTLGAQTGLSAAATEAPTAVPPTAVPTVAAPTEAPTAAPPFANVIASWKVANPEGVVFGFDSVWVPSRRDPNVITRIDPASNEVVAVTKGTGYLAKSATVSGDAVWVAGQASDMAPIDPQTNTVGKKVPGDHPRIAYTLGSIWAVGHQGEPLDRVDPATGQILASIQLGGKVSDTGEENEVLVTDSSVWVITNAELIKIDPATNSVALRTTFDTVVEQAKAQTTVPAGKGTDFIWLSIPGGLVRMDPDTGAGLTFLKMPRSQDSDIAATEDAIWVAANGQLSRVDVARNQIEASYVITPGYARIGSGFGSIWLVYENANRVQRLDIAP